jgi:hypothetical protein
VTIERVIIFKNNGWWSMFNRRLDVLREAAEAEESALDENGKLDVTKLNILMFDNAKHGYFTVGEQVGTARSGHIGVFFMHITNERINILKKKRADVARTENVRLIDEAYSEAIREYVDRTEN